MVEEAGQEEQPHRTEAVREDKGFFAAQELGQHHAHAGPRNANGGGNQVVDEDVAAQLGDVLGGAVVDHAHHQPAVGHADGLQPEVRRPEQVQKGALLDRRAGQTRRVRGLNLRPDRLRRRLVALGDLLEDLDGLVQPPSGKEPARRLRHQPNVDYEHAWKDGDWELEPAPLPDEVREHG